METGHQTKVHTTVSQSPQWIVATSTGYEHRISRPPKPELRYLKTADPLNIKIDGQAEFQAIILEITFNSSMRSAAVKVSRFKEPAGQILHIALFQDGTTNQWPGIIIQG